MKHSLAITAVLFAAIACAPKNETPLYLDRSASIESRVEDALSRMTLNEKLAVIHAQSKFSSAGVPRLGIPELWCTDGPHGIRPEVLWDEWDQAGWTNDSCVAFPALTALAASWDTEMSALYGKSIGEEARFRGKDVLLGPGVNIYRTPLGGRNFEYMGEDPFLASKMVVPYVQNVQKQGVATCVKHYALNNEETHRHTVSVDLDDRALYEIYLPAFKAAVVEGGTWSIMSSYNLYRGQHVSHNHRLLNEILKGEWGFDGAVISDWGGVHNTREAIFNGMDLEFGSWTDGLSMGKTNAYYSYYLADPYKKLIESGEVGTKELDDKVRRVLRLNFRTAMAEAPKGAKPSGSLCSDDHIAAARQIGANGIVLLKNEGSVLPVKASAKKILVVGENAIKMMTVGGGSSSLKVKKEVSPLDGIIERANGAEVMYERGYVGDTSGSYNGVTTGQDLSESRSAEQLIADAVAKAAEADVVIFIGGLNKKKHQDCEGRDRLDMDLPYGQDAVISALAAANSNLAVLLVSGNAVTMPWIAEVPAIAQVWYLGSEAGHSIADVLFGDVNPSGKLPFTFPVQLADSPAHQSGMSFPNDGECVYGEGIYVGYRWFDHKAIRPLFAFGHGLSYTTFEFGEANAKVRAGKVVVKVDVCNTGSVAGAEVVQVYIKDSESLLPRPEKELKGFCKVCLEPGESKKVEVEIPLESLKYFDADKHEWVCENGAFTALVGAASDDIRTQATFSVRF